MIFTSLRKPKQTIAEILLAYSFLGLFLGIRDILDRRDAKAFRISDFEPKDVLSSNISSSSAIYYYPGKFYAFSNSFV